MADVYIYHYAQWDGRTHVPSERRATLETIKNCGGQPLMESQLVADSTELDRDGFLRAEVAGSAHPWDDLSSEIKSLDLRAASRDNEALALNEATDGENKYMLSLESRELRNQSRRLRRQRAESMTARQDDTMPDFGPLGSTSSEG